MPKLRVVGARKRYGETVAVGGVDLALEAGRLHAVVGENGAGKSTLLGIAAGIVRPDEGHVEVDGARLAPHTAARAIRAGVGMVTQHFSLVPVLTALENAMLGAEPAGLLGWIDRGAACAKLARVLEELDVTLDLSARAGDLSVGDRQRLEIARVLYRDAKVVILDEPTAVLAPQEAAPLYAMLRRMADAGRAVCVVTHKLDEVFAHADEVTVLRRGAIVARRGVDRSAAQADFVAELSRDVMGGEPPAGASLRPTAAPGADVLVLEEVALPPRLRGVSLRVRAGEVVGVCGVEGSGQDELAHVLAGLERAEGVVRTPGSSGPPAVVHADRHREGLVLDASVQDNALLGELAAHARFGMLDGRSMREEAADRVRRAGVVPADLRAPARALSGGNQQKVVVERACARADGKGVRVLALSQPTRGVDVGAARAIHERIAAVARLGVGVLVMSSDLDELRALSSRLLVLARGAIVAEVPPDTAPARLGELMLGGAA